MSKKVLIVGGVAGGASAAARLRRLDEHAEIIMFEKGPHISFANCGLPYYIGGSITDRERLLVQTPKGMTERFRIDVRTESEVIAVDAQRRTITVNSRSKGIYEEQYDELILSPGARPIVPELPGVDHPLIRTVRNVSDIDNIKQLLDANNNGQAIVIGGGFIGVEMAENLHEAGMQVTLIEGNQQILSPFDHELAAQLAQHMEQQGIRLLFGQRVEGFTSLDDLVGVQLANGHVLSAHLVILAIGVKPDTAFLHDSGITLGARGHIIVNEALETNQPHIYAVGDATEWHGQQGQIIAIPLAGPANKQGRIAADRIAGLPTLYKGTQGTSILKVFQLTGASTGSNEKTLRRLGLPYHSVIVHPSSHASYYPGASPITLKLLFTPQGRIMGAQAIGYEGVDKRIDDIAIAMRFGGHVSDLAELELSYAPPYSSAKDPVNIAGYAADNMITGRAQMVTYDQLEQLYNAEDASILLIDVRSQIEHDNGHIPGSLSIPVDELRDRLDELDANKRILVYCQVGLRGYTASQILRQHGYHVANLSGGYKTWRQAQFRPASLPTFQDKDRTGQIYHHQGSVHDTKPTQQTSHPISQPQQREQQTSVAEHVSARSPEGSAASEHTATSTGIDLELDVCGLSCPGPLIQVKQMSDQMTAGQQLRVRASDPGFYEDIKAWCKMSGYSLLRLEYLAGGVIEAVLRKPTDAEQHRTQATRLTNAIDDIQQPTSPPASTMVVFSGDLDKAIASFIIANGAAASGRKVTMFFTFWGLNMIRKPQQPPVQKDMLGRMFGFMMPRGSRKLGMSKMNMLGIGPRMIRGVMGQRNIASLEELIQSALSQGVELVACQMSMDVMGIQREELLDDVMLGGVGYYLGQADQSNHNLFI
ncbi:FAD-dependent oxidoreductase [Paenibacillus kandeliae]|uniref:FAD-dependent oxidoreductase n=1 Tax=Paenibacillus kandeliae TaxID=3231269 RepID=UPI0034594E20